MRRERTVLFSQATRKSCSRSLGIESSIENKLVVGGDWHSADNIGIRVTSALAPPRKAKALALGLCNENPFRAWLPLFEEHQDGDEYYRSGKEPYQPWIVWPSTEMRLDGTDPLAAYSAIRRLHFAKTVNAVGMLKTTDPFKRKWIDSEGRVAALSQAWGRIRMRDEGDPMSGERLVCSADFLKTVLAKHRAELLLLVVLRRYDKGLGSRGSQYWHTTAVIRVKKSLDFEFFPGLINELHVMKY
jgi:hypothetical protein